MNSIFKSCRSLLLLPFVLGAILHSLLLIEFASAQTGGAKTPEALIEAYDLVMGPKNFEAEVRMTSTREDGTTRSYDMKMIKLGNDKFRIWFLKPLAVAGQEILRVGENNWLYLPNLKRTSRIANRDSFQGGDFNNADILRVNYREDYLPSVLKDTSVPNSAALELKAKSNSSSYDKIHLWLNPENGAPLKAQFFGTSGKMLRSAEYSNPKMLDGKLARPVRIVMKNEIVPARKSELEYSVFKTDVSFPAQRFSQTDLGK